jgi:hypothetical protein
MGRELEPDPELLEHLELLENMDVVEESSSWDDWEKALEAEEPQDVIGREP